MFQTDERVWKHIDGVLCDFWWRSKEGKHRISWDDISKLKHMGGLGFRNIKLFNIALLAHQAWRLLHDLSYLSAWVLKGLLFPGV